ncbi:MAG TPA: hypothetical protein DEA85_08485 [Firmicutes bacterium]|nr:hypothetical protein [Bacillota bacterium]
MNQTAKMIVVLGLIAAISAGLLAGVNMLTKDIIAANSEERLYETLAQVIDADEFIRQEETELAFWHAMKNGELAGYVVRLVGKGYSSAGIDMLVGLDSEARVTGVLIFSHSETPGLGSKVAAAGYLDQFVGKGLESPFAAGEDVDAISGATSSSMAVIGSVRKAVQFVGAYAGLVEDTSIDFAKVPDGVYTGTGRGFGGDITVKVTFAGGKLTDVEIVSHKESPNVSDPAIKQIPQAMIDEQTVEVDAVSGATMSSEGIKAAVRDALAEFGGQADVPIDISSLLPGKYTGTARGFSSDITVEVTVAGGKITEITIISQDDTAEVSGPAFAAIIAAIKQEQSLDVDLVSGATYSSEGLVEAVKNALRSEGVLDLSYLPDGKYIGEAEGFSREPIRVSFTMKDGRISSVQILTHGDTVGVAEPAFSQLSSAIEVGQTLDVDLVSGASYSSQGMLDAMINAIKAGPSSGTGQ